VRDLARDSFRAFWYVIWMTRWKGSLRCRGVRGAGDFGPGAVERRSGKQSGNPGRIFTPLALLWKWHSISLNRPVSHHAVQKSGYPVFLQRFMWTLERYQKRLIAFPRGDQNTQHVLRCKYRMIRPKRRRKIQGQYPVKLVAEPHMQVTLLCATLIAGIVIEESADTDMRCSGWLNSGNA
jgi:hypothetical protein